MNQGLKKAKRFGAVVAGLSGLLLFVPLLHVAPTTTPVLADEPVITFQKPEDGDVLKAPPFVLQMCFKEPINIKDLDKGGDFHFSLTPPDNKGLGMRIVFQPDGYGVAVYPGKPADESAVEGEWNWEYRVVDNVKPADATEGEVKFSVSAADGEDIISATPPACLAQGATQVATSSPAGSPGATKSPSPTQTDGNAGSPSVIPTSGGSGGGPIDEDGDSDVDILRLALLTIGAAGAAALLALIGYVVRKRIGYEPHAPHDGEGPAEHH